MIEQEGLAHLTSNKDRPAKPEGALMVLQQPIRDWRGALACFVVVGTMAGLALGLTNALGLRPWVLFLTWVGYGFLGVGLKSGVKLVAGFVFGAAAGMVTVILGAVWEPWTDAFAMPLALGLSCGLLATLERHPPFDIVPAYFLGMISFFATGAQPTVPLLWSLAASGILGIVWGWSAAPVQAAVERLFNRG